MSGIAALLTGMAIPTCHVAGITSRLIRGVPRTRSGNLDPAEVGRGSAVLHVDDDHFVLLDILLRDLRTLVTNDVRSLMLRGALEFNQHVDYWWKESATRTSARLLARDFAWFRCGQLGALNLAVSTPGFVASVTRHWRHRQAPDAASDYTPPRSNSWNARCRPAIKWWWTKSHGHRR